MSLCSGCDLLMSGLKLWSRLCLVPGSVVVVLRFMTEETVIGNKDSTAGNEIWSSYVMDEDNGISFDMDISYSPDFGDEWKNWRVDDPALESDQTVEEGLKKKRKKHLRNGGGAIRMSAEPTDGRWVTQKWRAGVGGQGLGDGAADEVDHRWKTICG